MASRFECSICISPFDDPRFLPCPGHHTFCRNCIEDYLKSTGNSTRPWTQFKCPNCRSKVVLPTDGVDGLTKNYYLEEPKSGYSPCKSHPKEDLRFYCSSCGEVICRDCKVVSHEGHKTETVEHITSELKSKIENVLDTANIDISVHEKQLQARIGGEQAEHKASLDFMKEYTVGLKAEIDRLLESLESLSKTRIDKGNRALTKVKEWIDGNHKSISQYKKSLTEGLNKKETDTRGAICDLNRLDKKLREIQNLTTPPDLHEDEDHNWSNRIDIEKIFLHISRRYNRALGELKEVVSMCKRQR